MRESIKAVFRPRRNEVAIMATESGLAASTIITVAQAHELHASLGEALLLARCPERPLRAVDGGER